METAPAGKLWSEEPRFLLFTGLVWLSTERSFRQGGLSTVERDGEDRNAKPGGFRSDSGNASNPICTAWVPVIFNFTSICIPLPTLAALSASVDMGDRGVRLEFRCEKDCQSLRSSGTVARCSC